MKFITFVPLSPKIFIMVILVTNGHVVSKWSKMFEVCNTLWVTNNRQSLQSVIWVTWKKKILLETCLPVNIKWTKVSKCLPYRFPVIVLFHKPNLNVIYIKIYTYMNIKWRKEIFKNVYMQFRSKISFKNKIYLSNLWKPRCWYFIMK